MNKETTYFTIEPYVYISVKKQGVFLYNTLNQKIIESDAPPVVNLVKRLIKGNRLRVIKLNRDRVKKDKRVVQFLDKARKYFMGDWLHGPADGVKPVQLVPMVGLHKEEPAEGKKKRDFSFAKRGQTYLGRLTLFINASCDLDCGMCRNAYRQFICCRQTRSTPRELDLEVIKKTLTEAGADALTGIDICGGDILKYKNFTGLMELLKNYTPTKNLYIHYLNLTGRIDGLTLPDPSFVLNIPVNFPVDRVKLESLLRRLENHNLNVKLLFIPQSEDELMLTRDILSTSGMNPFSISPYYNGGNLHFFKKYVYIKKKNLLNSKPSIKDILARTVINHTWFGHLVILNNGSVYSNLNGRPLGNIHGDSIGRLLFKELRKRNHWLKTRETVQPCRDCHYRLLCPSISNYEYAVGKHNLCTILQQAAAPTWHGPKVSLTPIS